MCSVEYGESGGNLSIILGTCECVSVCVCAIGTISACHRAVPFRVNRKGPCKRCSSCIIRYSALRSNYRDILCMAGNVRVCVCECVCVYIYTCVVSVSVCLCAS